MSAHYPAAHYPAFVKRDLDGFFGLLIDNLVQLLLISLLCAQACGMTGNVGFRNSDFGFVHLPLAVNSSRL